MLKPSIVGKLFRWYILGRITYAEYTGLATAVDRVFLADLEELNNSTRRGGGRSDSQGFTELDYIINERGTLLLEAAEGVLEVLEGISDYERTRRDVSTSTAQNLASCGLMSIGNKGAPAGSGLTEQLLAQGITP